MSAAAAAAGRVTDLEGGAMSDADDYESLPPATPLSVSATAGAMAGIAEHCAMFPVDRWDHILF